MAEHTPNIWFTDNFTSIGAIFGGLKESRKRFGESFGGFRTILSSKRESFPGSEDADEFFVEPEGLKEEEYKAWAMEVIKRLRIDYVIPGHKRAWLADLSADAAELPWRPKILAAGSREVVEGLEDKAWTFREMEARGLGDLVAPWASAKSAEELEAAFGKIKDAGARRLCLKPARGVYGSGFRFLSPFEAPGLPKSPQSDWPRRLTMEQALEASRKWQPHEELIAMPLLAGPEFSVDAFAAGGRLIGSVCRAKRGRTQRAEKNEKALDAAERFAKAFRMNGFFNLQARVEQGSGKLKILEINPRLAGGVSYGQEAGLDLVYWSVAWLEGWAGEEDFPEMKAEEPLSVKAGRLPMRIASRLGLAEKSEKERKERK